ncbi:unnamed protein product [Moneuplotes crassus]|uniref:Uncharacterized protein n=1 Tax=Euplotes crassus TaxID=5936 RepID=A0AAD1UTC5_EUPCR|nr:unnamed protein product [Moneuplotes crassus]
MGMSRVRSTFDIHRELESDTQSVSTPQRYTDFDQHHAKKYNFQRRMKEDIFDKSHFYLGYSSNKRSDLGNRLKAIEKSVSTPVQDLTHRSLGKSTFKSMTIPKHFCTDKI